MNKVANKEYLGLLRKEEDTLSQLNYNHADAKVHFEFVNIALRVTVAVAAVVKIIAAILAK